MAAARADLEWKVRRNQEERRRASDDKEMKQREAKLKMALRTAAEEANEAQGALERLSMERERRSSEFASAQSGFMKLEVELERQVPLLEQLEQECSSSERTSRGAVKSDSQAAQELAKDLARMEQEVERSSVEVAASEALRDATEAEAQMEELAAWQQVVASLSAAEEARRARLDQMHLANEALSENVSLASEQLSLRIEEQLALVSRCAAMDEESSAAASSQQQAQRRRELQQAEDSVRQSLESVRLETAQLKEEMGPAAAKQRAEAAASCQRELQQLAGQREEAAAQCFRLREAARRQPQAELRAYQRQAASAAKLRGSGEEQQLVPKAVAALQQELKEQALAVTRLREEQLQQGAELDQLAAASAKGPGLRTARPRERDVQDVVIEEAVVTPLVRPRPPDLSEPAPLCGTAATITECNDVGASPRSCASSTPCWQPSVIEAAKAAAAVVAASSSSSVASKAAAAMAASAAAIAAAPTPPRTEEKSVVDAATAAVAAAIQTVRSPKPPTGVPWQDPPRDSPQTPSGVVDALGAAEGLMQEVFAEVSAPFRSRGNREFGGSSPREEAGTAATPTARQQMPTSPNPVRSSGISWAELEPSFRLGTGTPEKLSAALAAVRAAEFPMAGEMANDLSPSRSGTAASELPAANSPAAESRQQEEVRARSIERGPVGISMPSMSSRPLDRELPRQPSNHSSVRTTQSTRSQRDREAERVGSSTSTLELPHLGSVRELLTSVPSVPTPTGEDLQSGASTTSLHMSMPAIRTGASVATSPTASPRLLSPPSLSPADCRVAWTTAPQPQADPKQFLPETPASQPSVGLSMTYPPMTPASITPASPLQLGGGKQARRLTSPPQSPPIPVYSPSPTSPRVPMPAHGQASLSQTHPMFTEPLRAQSGWGSLPKLVRNHSLNSLPMVAPPAMRPMPQSPGCPESAVTVKGPRVSWATISTGALSPPRQLNPVVAVGGLASPRHPMSPESVRRI